MDKSFSLQRLRMLITINFVENRGNYFLMGSALIAVLLIMMLPVCFFRTYNNLSQLAQFAAVPLVMILGSSLYTSYALTHFATGSKGMLGLMAPASTLEKFVASLIVNLAFLLLFLLFFWELHFRTIEFGNRIIPESGMKYSLMTKDVIIYISFCYFLVNAAVLLGSIYFIKSSYVKTFTFVLMVCVLLSLSNTAFAQYLASYPLMMGAFPLGGWNIVHDAGLKVYRVPFPKSALPILYGTPVLMIIGLWFNSYQRLKEKQI
jgi:hypothetical protein